MVLGTHLQQRSGKTGKRFPYKDRILLVLVLSQFLLIPGYVAAQNNPLYGEGQSGVLLLRNGQLLAGRFTSTGFGYELTLKGGGIIRLKTEQVEFVSDSLDEIYSFRRASKVNNTAAAHLEMATWCLKNQLYDHSGYHLREAIRMDPRHPGIKQTQTRLAIAKSTPVNPTPAPSHSPSKLISNVAILERVKQMEPLAVQVFTSQIQALLLNKCAVAGCHGPNPRSKYQLITASWTKTIPQNISLRNLYSSVQYVNFPKPENSAILTRATNPHGGLKQALMSVQQEPDQLKTMVNWVRLLTTAKLTDEENVNAERRLQSPIIFKASNFENLGNSQGKRVEIPEDPDAKHVKAGAYKSMKTPEGPEDNTFTRFSQPLGNIKLSSDFDNLPLLTNKNGLLKVFQPPAVKTNDLTPNFDAAFQLPSDFIFKNRTPRDKSQYK